MLRKLLLLLQLQLPILFFISVSIERVNSHQESGEWSCESGSEIRVDAEFKPGLISLDGQAEDWKDIDGFEFSLLPALDPHPDHEYKAGKMTVKALHDGHDVFFMLQVDGDYVYSKGKSNKCPSVSLMFRIGDSATYHDMGGCSQGRGSCTNKTCKGHEVDIMHFSIGSAIPGRLYGGNLVDNSEGNGGDRFGHLVDLYAWNPHCRYLDGLGPSGNDTSAQNDWKGAWWHSSFDINSEPVGRAGGLALFWSLGVELEVVYFDKNVISALVYFDPPNSPWMLFAIYGPCRRNKRIVFWEMLENMVRSFSGPWLVIGDLNCIKRADEKKGGRFSPESSINCLRDFMTNTGAIDLGFNGPSFTWSNRHEGLANIKERLDQCLCDQDWKILFPKAGVKHLSNANSDHNPILLDTHLEPENLNRPFRFEAMWTKDERSNIVVENGWQANVEGSNGFRLARKLEETKKDLKKWNKEVFGLVRERIKAIQANIAELQ
nr:hypothetical protein CFP56_07291 [Quercus suber]